MYVRALIVVLIVLNAGVALWWAVQPPPAPPPAPPQPTGVARLELLPTLTAVGGAALPGAAATTGSASAAESESTASATPASTPVSASAPTPTPAAVASAAASTPASTTSATAAVAETPRAAAETSATTKTAATPADSVAAAKPSPTASPPPVPAAERCASLGPFAARADADAGLARVRGQASRATLREDKDAGVSTFRVMLPNVGDRAAAQALVKRIAAAGMGDYYVIAQGEDNTVALGQYQSRERAERRQASLVGAGFPAQLVPSGSGQSRWWIDLRSSAATSVLQRAAGAARARSLDCAALR
ncbi:SPOR domain-containing protein [Xanthomonas prunicola]|uniref:SPOR domain-containing protein n=1 Tax=Xanthomonas prunicola TaxID=2053930 RepID=UPI0021B39DDE|nr:SPOR domain-containing protein [Xanthomonas prunicola]UXA54872.1 SPOR domain-containing protein [Xanthomonas prunicola]